MFRKLDDFFAAQTNQCNGLSKNIGALTVESLMFLPFEGTRTPGQLVWHIVQTIPEMMARTGLAMEYDESLPVPNDSAVIARAYEDAHANLSKAIKTSWDDSTLEIEDNLYGTPWKRGTTLAVLLGHETHHHGQLTVMMRLAGLPVHGVMGPSKEEWQQFGMEEPPQPQQVG